jgi:hypothetical protein
MNRLKSQLQHTCCSFLFLFCLVKTFWAQETEVPVLMPVIEGDFWQIAGNPDLGELTGEKQQPVDFGIWQARDGTWQLWSCIRGTKCGGNTRLFYRWESLDLMDKNWKPTGISMMADTMLGESLGGLQAPYVIKENDLYYMFYGDWNRICLAVSKNGKDFDRVLRMEDGEPDLFTEDTGEPPRYNHARDPMVLKIGNTYYCYYTSHTSVLKEDGAAYCRTSLDKSNWSESVIVSHTAPFPGNSPRYSDECPHVVYLEENELYYLFVTQIYGKDSQTTVYASPNPLYFGIDDDTYYVIKLPVAAPEIIFHDNQYYIASTMPTLDGIWIAKLKWVE